MSEQDPRDEPGLDTEMRETLRRHAADAPRMDLTSATLRQARRIRLRRRVATGAATLAVAAVVVPVGAVIVHDSQTSHVADGTDPSPSGTNAATGTSTGTLPAPPVSHVALARLSTGKTPTVPYIFKSTLLHDGAESSIPGVPTDALDQKESMAVIDAAVFSDGVGGFVTDTSDRQTALRVSGSTALPTAKGATNPAVDNDGSIAFAVNGVDAAGRSVDAATILYADSLADAPRYASTDGLTVRQVMDVEDGVVLFNATTPDGDKMVGSTDLGNSSPAKVEQPWPNVVSLSAADQAGGLMVGRTTDMRHRQRHCSAMLSTNDASELWRSCDWRPTEFSPDGSRVFAVAVPVTGLGVRDAAVLDAQTGRVIREFTTTGAFGRATFEDDNALDIVTVDGHDSGIVRCTEDGACELATKPQPAKPDSLVVPYQLIANP